MVISRKRLGIIDFNRLDFGDPWEEFNRIVWCVDCSPAFASGQIDGYFEGSPPEEFFHLMALYIACNQLSSIYWAIPFGEGEINIMRNQAKKMLEYYNGMETVVPQWYKKL